MTIIKWSYDYFNLVINRKQGVSSPASFSSFAVELPNAPTFFSKGEPRNKTYHIISSGRYCASVTQFIKLWAERDSNPHGLSPVDFKSTTSTIPSSAQVFPNMGGLLSPPYPAVEGEGGIKLLHNPLL